MATNFIAVPHGHTVIHLHLLHCLTHTMQVYNRPIATGYANLIQQAIMGFPSTPETSNMKGPTPCKSEVKTEILTETHRAQNTNDLHHRLNPLEDLHHRLNPLEDPTPTSRNLFRSLTSTNESIFSKKPRELGKPLISQRTT